MEEKFNNFERAKKIRCPTMIVHGLRDNLVSHNDSIDLLRHSFNKCKAHLFLRDYMVHNKFDFEFDLLKPLQYFFYTHHNMKFKNTNLIETMLKKRR